MASYPEWLDKGVDNIDILCKDVPLVFEFYRDIIGLPVLQNYDPELHMAAVTTGTVDIFFLPTCGEHKGTYSGDNDVDPAGISAFALRVNDYYAAEAHLDPHVTWAAPMVYWEHPCGWSYRFRHFYDPEGNQVLVTEPRNRPALGQL